MLIWFLNPIEGGNKAASPENLSPISYNEETWYNYTLLKLDPINL